MRDPWGYWDLDPDQQADLIAYHQILHAPHEEQQSQTRGKVSSGSVTLNDLKWYLSHPTIYRDLAHIKTWENGGKKATTTTIIEQAMYDRTQAGIKKENNLSDADMKYWFNHDH